MLKKLISKLEQSRGQSEYVIAVVVDIRGFSSFSTTHQAPDVGTFIAKFYTALLKRYFSKAVYVKPTGDGLLIIFPFTENTLNSDSEEIVSNCIKAVHEYPQLLTEDPMITFPMPGEIGIGIARGTAFSLFSGKEIIDYSGPVLNLATRLNDFARPKGVVVDGAFKLEKTISDDLRAQFVKNEKVYIRGIAESNPTSIWHSKDVILNGEVSIPITTENWEKFEKMLAYADIKKLKVDNYYLTLPKVPQSQGKIKVALSYKSPDLANHLRSKALKIVEYENDANGPKVTISAKDMQDKLKDQKLKSSDVITITIQFVAKLR